MLGNNCSKVLENGADACAHKGLGRRIGTAFTAGCLALSMCPVVALAAPGGDQNMPEQGNPPAMQQVNDIQAPNGQAPSGEAPDGQAPNGELPDGQAPSGEAPSGQAPDGQQPNGQAPDGQQPAMGGQPGNDALSDQTRQTLADEYGIEMPALDGDQAKNGAPQGAPEDAPALPEGAVNIQQMIDSVRDVIAKFGADNLSSKLSDSDFADEVKDYAVSANDQRLADFASQTTPTDKAAASDKTATTDKAASTDEQAPAFDKAVSTVDSSVMKQVVSLLMNAFGYSTNA